MMIQYKSINHEYLQLHVPQNRVVRLLIRVFEIWL